MAYCMVTLRRGKPVLIFMLRLMVMFSVDMRDS